MKFYQASFSKWSLTLFIFILGATEAFAETSSNPASSADSGGSALAQGAMLAAFALIFYFLILRPQSKRAKEHRALITGLQKGDEILTSGGILGRVSKLTDDFIMVTIAEGIDVAIQRQAVAAVLPKGTMKGL